MVFFRWLSAICCLGMVLVAQVAQSATVNGVRVWRAPDHTRIVLDLDAPVQHSLTLAGNPDRIILDVPNSKLLGDLVKLPLADTPVTVIRSYVHNKTDLRLVLDLKAKVAPNSFSLKASAGMHDRLVIDLYDEVAPAVTATLPAAPATTAPASNNKPVVTQQVAKPSTAPSGSQTAPSALKLLPPNRSRVQI
jgi:N-acetylmuramoyl-L-alanine amidase